MLSGDQDGRRTSVDGSRTGGQGGRADPAGCARQRAARRLQCAARMLWCDDDVLLAYADLVDAVDDLRRAWRRHPDKARLEHAQMLIEERMGHALEERAQDEAEIATHDAYVAVVALGQLLLGEREVREAEMREAWDERETWSGDGPGAGGEELDHAWRMMGVMLDAMTGYVSSADDALRRVLLEGEALEDALARLESAGA